MYSITCNCGHEVKGEDRRMVEAEQWVHAIKDHADMLKGMSADQFYAILSNWDKDFAAQSGK